MTRLKFCIVALLALFVLSAPALAWRQSAPTPAGGLVNIPGLSLGSIAVNSLDSTHLSNEADTVSQNTLYTPLQTKYLRGPDLNHFIVKTLGSYRDVEVSGWGRDIILFVRLDDTGRAIYFNHNGETTNGILRIGIATGVGETNYLPTANYPLYSNADLVHTVPGYSNGASDTTGQYFTFGVSGFDIYVKYNGVEFARFKEYRQMNAGIVGLKANTGYGWRGNASGNLTVTPLPSQHVYSRYSLNELDLRDFGVRSIQTTGTILATSNSLAIAAKQNFQVGDWVIVEIGAEAGAGARGTIGVGGQWPALYKADIATLNADTTEVLNTYAWIQSTGNVYRWSGSVWNAVDQTTSYFIAKALPQSLHGRISTISPDGLTLTLTDAAGNPAPASATATNANVYLDNQPYVNYITGDQTSNPGVIVNLAAITPTNATVIFPAGTYAGSGVIRIGAQAGWTIKGQGQSATTLFSPKGTFPLGLATIGQYSGFKFSDFTLTSNFGLDKFGLTYPGWTWVSGGLAASGLLIPHADPSDNGNVTQTNVAQGSAYPFGILIVQTNNVTLQDITVNDVSQKAIGVSFSNNVNAYRITNNQNYPTANYIQWQFQWANTNGGSCVDCVINSAWLIKGFESFAATGHQFIRPVSTNASFSENNSQGWLIQDGQLTVTAGSQSSSASSFNEFDPLVNVNTNIGSGNVASGGTVSNFVSVVQGVINANNDVPVNITVNIDNPNVTITGGSYTAPDWASPSALNGPVAILSSGLTTTVSGYRACGVTGFRYKNINMTGAGSSVTGSTAQAIVAPTQSGNTVPCP